LLSLLRGIRYEQRATSYYKTAIAVFHITKAAGRYVDRFILVGEIATLVGFVVYFLTDWLDVYRERLFFALFLLLGLVALLHGMRCKARVWGALGGIGGAVLIITTILYATTLDTLVQEYSPLALGLGTLLSLLSLVFGRPAQE